MNGLGLKAVEPQEWALQQRLAVCRSRYPFEDGHAQLAVSHPPAGLDMALRVHWRGVPLRWLCHRACLAQWLAPRLQEAAFASLPPALQLALLEVEAASFNGLVWESVEPCVPTARTPCLSLSLSRGSEQLVGWLEGDPGALLAMLAPRPLREMQPVALVLSLQWGPVALTPALLNSVCPGDVLLLPAHHDAQSPLLAHIEGRPWAHVLPEDSHLKVLAMHTPPPTDPDHALAGLDQLDVQVSFEVGRQTLDLHTLAALEPGALIDLACGLEGEVRILANQRCVGTGELVRIQDRLGVRVTRLLPGSAA